MITIIKFFIIVILVSSSVVWLTNNPGTLTFLWNNYLIETNSLGLIFSILVLVTIIIFCLSFTRKIKNIPREFRISKQEKNLVQASKTLDSLAYNLFLGNADELQKDTRKVKKYLNNDFFSNFLLFQSSLIQNNLFESKKYLKILKTNDQYKYLTNRAEVIILIKENDIDTAKKVLEQYCKEYPKDNWFHEKLSTVYSLEANWIKAHDILEKVKKVISNENKRKLANLKVLSQKNVVEALVMSNSSIIVMKENIKHYIDNSNIKKASQLLIKSWSNLLCFELMEIFITYKSKNSKDCLTRYKLISRSFKKLINYGGNETKLSLAYACYKSSLWGEAQNFLDKIEIDIWDLRVLELHKSISAESNAIKLKDHDINLIPSPLWTCNMCGAKSEKWEYICKNCQSIDSIQWPKIKVNSANKIDFYYEFLKDSFRQLPKVK